MDGEMNGEMNEEKLGGITMLIIMHKICVYYEKITPSGTVINNVTLNTNHGHIIGNAIDLSVLTK